ncbi:AAA family ATPase [Saprospira grandis]|uniref:ATP binding protein n=1 Tax=Saprospira grandis (strain Lewin) TaxID=984262 RepID=H6L099_SAPGL|nr:AAA family ATPase [Saprospira grandis]AFC26263.1 putative ATP binding protein [Saprospira grandis str. Lewin]
MSTLQLRLHRIRGIHEMSIDINLTPDLYVITGENASGKSTVMASIASIFYKRIVKQLLLTKEKSYINFSINNETIFNLSKSSIHTYHKPYSSVHDDMLRINGFYEGSVAFGNRFRINEKIIYSKDKYIDKTNDLIAASEFVKNNLGFIIRDNANYYNDLFFLPHHIGKEKYDVNHVVYFFKEKNSYGLDDFISQYSLSTGENLIITLLHSLERYVRQRASTTDTYIVLLDEIEFGLHPSALKRLLSVLRKEVKNLGIVVYFASHSIELIRNIKPDNIYFLNKKEDNSVAVTNPCYPAYATRDIFEHNGYDCLILVEDELTRILINKLLMRNKTKTSKLIHILPVGGWQNVLSLHQEIIKSNMLGSTTPIVTILDGDIKNLYEKVRGDHKNINVTFLPIESLEKYLLKNLIKDPKQEQIKKIGDSLFTRNSIDIIISDYKNNERKDPSGKILLKHLLKELNSIGISDEKFHEFISDLVLENVDTKSCLKKITDALQKANKR